MLDVLEGGFGDFDVALLPARTVHRVRNPWDLYRKTTFAIDWFADMDLEGMPSHTLPQQVSLWHKLRSY